MKQKLRIQPVLLFLCLSAAGAVLFAVGNHLVNRHVISQVDAFLFFAALTTCAAWSALIQRSARVQMEAQLVEDRKELLAQMHHYIDDVLGTLLARALQCPTQYYAHRISEALDHIEIMFQTVICHWGLHGHRPEP